MYYVHTWPWRHFFNLVLTVEELYSSTSNHENYLPTFSNDNYITFLPISQNSQLLSLVSVGISNFKRLFFFFFQDQLSLLNPEAIAKNSRTGGSSPFLSPGFWSLQSCNEMCLDSNSFTNIKPKGGTDTSQVTVPHLLCWKYYII